MKNLKKVLALVLAFACAFTMMAGAVVYPDVPAGSDYSEAITMLSDLGVITGDTDGKYHPERTITRAEACALIARLLTGETDVSKYQGASNFADVAKTAWYESAVGYCVANGIVRGYPDGTFKPAQTINDAEFVTMLVRAMGYETAANPLSFPYGYISAAQTFGLLEDVTVVPASGALRGEDAQMMYNALFADFARGAKVINTVHGTTVETYPTIAEQVFGLTRASVGTTDKDGNVELCKAHTWLVVGKDCTPGEVDQIVAYPIADGKTDLYEMDEEAAVHFTYEGDVDALVGYQVELYGAGKHGEFEYDKSDKAYKAEDWEIKAIKTVKGQTAYEYNPSQDLPDVDFNKVKLSVADKPYKYADDKDVKEFLETKNSASYNLIDWDSDGEIDYIDGEITDYYEVTTASKSLVRLAGFTTDNKLALDTDGKTDADKAFDDSAWKNYVLNVELPEDLEEGDVVAIKWDCVAGKKTTDMNGTIEVVEPVTKEVTKVDTKKGVYFDDELIEVADSKSGDPKFYFGTAGDTNGEYYKMNESNIDDWDLWLDANGFIIKMAESDSSAGYIFVTGLEEGANVTGDRSQMVVSGVYGDNTKAKDVKIANTAYIYIDSERNGDEFVNVYDKSSHALAGSTEVTDVIGNAYKYSMNEDGEITRLTEVALTMGDPYSFDEDTDRLDATVGGSSVKSWLNDAKVIFAVRDNTAYDDGDNVTDQPEKEIDLDDVMAVEYKDVPSIGDKTEGWGVRYDRTEKTADIDVAVLGVSTFRYFGNISNKAAMVTNVIYNSRNDNYTIEGIVPGMDGTSFETIDEDDFIDGEDITTLDYLYDELNKNSSSKHAVYAELEFNKDGKVISIDVMDRTDDEKATIASGSAFTTSRVIGDRVSTSSRLTADVAVSNGDGKIYTYNTAEFDRDWKITDDTKFYEVDADLNLPANGKILNPYVDAFADDIKLSKVTEGDKSDLDSFIENTEEDDKYVVMDVICKGDDGDAVAVFYFKDTVKEAEGSYKGTLSVETEDGMVAFAAGKDVVATYDLPGGATAGSNMKVYDAEGNQVSGSSNMFVYKSNSANTVTWETAASVKAGTYYVIYKEGTADELKASFTVEKTAAPELRSAEYNADKVVLTFANATDAKVYEDVLTQIHIYDKNDDVIRADKVELTTGASDIITITFENSIDAANNSVLKFVLPATDNVKSAEGTATYNAAL